MKNSEIDYQLVVPDVVHEELQSLSAIDFLALGFVLAELDGPAVGKV